MFFYNHLEENLVGAGVGEWVWVVIAVFFMIVFIGWLASKNGWLVKKESSNPINESHSDSNPHSS